MTHEEFSPHIVLMVLRIYIHVFWIFLCRACGVISQSLQLFLWFLIHGLAQVLFLNTVVNFSTAIFLLLSLD